MEYHFFTIIIISMINSYIKAVHFDFLNSYMEALTAALLLNLLLLLFFDVCDLGIGTHGIVFIIDSLLFLHVFIKRIILVKEQSFVPQNF